VKEVLNEEYEISKDYSKPILELLQKNLEKANN